LRSLSLSPCARHYFALTQEHQFTSKITDRLEERLNNLNVSVCTYRFTPTFWSVIDEAQVKPAIPLVARSVDKTKD
jgi:hypothetical protein